MEEVCLVTTKDTIIGENITVVLKGCEMSKTIGRKVVVTIVPVPRMGYPPE